MKIHFIDKKAGISVCGKADFVKHEILTIVPSETTCQLCVRTTVFKSAQGHEKADKAS